MSELRVGGLALIIKSECPKEVGTTVTTLELITANGEKKVAPDGYLFDYKSLDPSWLVVGRVCAVRARDKKIIGRGWSIYSPRALLPIDDEDFSHEREKEYINDYGL